MNTQKFNLRETATDLGRYLHVKLTTAHSRLADKRWDHPWQQSLMRGAAAVTFCGLFMNSAYADGFDDLFGKAADQGDGIKAKVGRLFAAVGFGGAGYGGWNWWRKGKEGEQSQVKTNQIVGPLLGGMALGATGYLMVKAGETVGVAGSSQGTLPN